MDGIAYNVGCVPMPSTCSLDYRSLGGRNSAKWCSYVLHREHTAYFMPNNKSHDIVRIATNRLAHSTSFSFCGRVSRFVDLHIHWFTWRCHFFDNLEQSRPANGERDTYTCRRANMLALTCASQCTITIYLWAFIFRGSGGYTECDVNIVSWIVCFFQPNSFRQNS